MRFDYELVLGLPHTNRDGLAEHLLLAYAGHLQWASLAAAIGVPLSSLRTLQGGEVYATFFFIEEQFPRDRSISFFGLDDRLAFSVSLRAFKSMAIEGHIVFDLAPRFSQDGAHPTIRFANIFITPERGNRLLRVAPPANADFSSLPFLPNAENPYHLTKEAERTGSLGLLGDGWTMVDPTAPFEARYTIDPDRDTNGAGLVYFANYVSFMDAAEQSAWSAVCAPRHSREAGRRSLLSRRIAYYGNVDVDDTVMTQVTLYRRHDDPDVVGMKYVVRRQHDGYVICRSEAVKLVTERTD